MVATPLIRLAGAACALALVAAACGGAGAEVDQATAEVLADRADRLAVLIEAGEHCAASVEAEALHSRTRTGVDAGALPEELGAEVMAVVADLAADLHCEEGDVPADGEPDDAPDRDKDEKDDDKDKDKDEKDDDKDDDKDKGRNGGKPPGAGRGGP